MAKNLIGLDISSGDVMLAVPGRTSYTLLVKRLPENVVQESKIIAPEQLAEFLRGIRRQNRILATKCAVILPDYSTYFRHITIPPMSIEQLKLNLPYEFRDYIGNTAEQYYFDYAVERTNRDESGNIENIEIVAAAVLKSTIAEMSSILKKAGMTLKVALPREMAIANLISHYMDEFKDRFGQELCVVDIGSDSTRVFIFRGKYLAASRIVEMGCHQIDLVVADLLHIDEYLAADYRAANHEGVLDLPGCSAVYDRIALEILKAVNFYSYNNPENTLSDVYFCGEGSIVQPLCAAITNAIQFAPHPFSDLLPETHRSEENVIRCAMAMGVAL